MTTDPYKERSCKDCKWYAESPIDEPMCFSPNPVNGYAMQVTTAVMRHSASTAVYPCGPEGRLWEPKQ